LVENDGMVAQLNNVGSDPQAREDYEAVMRHVAQGTSIELELAQRVRERADVIAEEIRREYGEVDVVQLLRDAREDA
jgi:hypothetical protein